jgi:hypothetical protein
MDGLLKPAGDRTSSGRRRGAGPVRTQSPASVFHRLAGLRDDGAHAKELVHDPFEVATLYVDARPLQRVLEFCAIGAQRIDVHADDRHWRQSLEVRVNEPQARIEFVLRGTGHVLKNHFIIRRLSGTAIAFSTYDSVSIPVCATG